MRLFFEINLRTEMNWWFLEHHVGIVLDLVVIYIYTFVQVGEFNRGNNGSRSSIKIFIIGFEIAY